MKHYPGHLDLMAGCSDLQLGLVRCNLLSGFGLVDCLIRLIGLMVAG